MTNSEKLRDAKKNWDTIAAEQGAIVRAFERDALRTIGYEEGPETRLRIDHGFFSQDISLSIALTLPGVNADFGADGRLKRISTTGVGCSNPDAEEIERIMLYAKNTKAAINLADAPAFFAKLVERYNDLIQSATYKELKARIKEAAELVRELVAVEQAEFALQKEQANAAKRVVGTTLMPANSERYACWRYLVTHVTPTKIKVYQYHRDTLLEPALREAVINNHTGNFVKNEELNRYKIAD